MLWIVANWENVVYKKRQIRVVLGRIICRQNTEEEVSMIVVTVWCLPKMSETQLNDLHRKIVAAVVDTEKLGIKTSVKWYVFSLLT
jgi:hypothetical protein